MNQRILLRNVGRNVGLGWSSAIAIALTFLMAIGAAVCFGLAVYGLNRFFEYLKVGG